LGGKSQNGHKRKKETKDLSAFGFKKAWKGARLRPLKTGRKKIGRGKDQEKVAINGKNVIKLPTL